MWSHKAQFNWYIMAKICKICRQDKRNLDNAKEIVILVTIASLVYIATRKTQATMFPLDVRQVVKVIV
jgi:hypothetical protein